MTDKSGARLISTLSTAIMLLAGHAASQANAQEPEHSITGKVTDQAQKPVSGANVILRTAKGTLLGTATTDRQGEFSISHELSRKCCLEVVPEHKSGLATALIENIPGDVTRTFIVPLKHGFDVSGRVAHDGKGLKGLPVKVTSIDASAERQTVHDGGSAKTARNGTFAIVLTPGAKRITVVNDRYDELQAEAHLDATITGDVELPDITLAKRKAHR